MSLLNEFIDGKWYCYCKDVDESLNLLILADKMGIETGVFRINKDPGAYHFVKTKLVCHPPVLVKEFKEIVNLFTKGV